MRICAEITKAAYDFENYKQIMGVVARRLQSEGEVWRHVYKSLLLLEYMCKHGPQKVCLITCSQWEHLRNIFWDCWGDKLNPTHAELRHITPSSNFYCQCQLRSIIPHVHICRRVGMEVVGEFILGLGKGFGGSRGGGVGGGGG